MSDYDHSLHNQKYPPNHLASGGGGAGLFWALFAVAALGVLVLIGGFGGGATTVIHPGGAGAEAPAIAADPEAISAESTAVLE